MSAEPVWIGVAVVEHDGRYLVGRRAPDRTLAGKAEFPGGKVEPHESPQSAAVRECKEETGLGVEPVRLLFEREFVYDHGTVDLRFWLCRAKPEDVREDHNGFCWLTVDELLQEDFPDANGPLLDLLKRDSPLL